jgi:uncharacterized membrane protein
VTFFVTKDVSISTAISILELFTKIFFFYVHERIWIKLSKFIKRRNLSYVGSDNT